MADKVVSVTLKAKVDGFTAGMQKAKASVDDLTKAAALASRLATFSVAGSRVRSTLRRPVRLVSRRLRRRLRRR